MRGDNGKCEQVVDIGFDYLLSNAVTELEQRLSLCLNRELRSTGLTVPQFSALARIGTRPGIGSVELAKLLRMSTQAATTLIKHLSAAGLIQREFLSRGLGSILHLTSKGVTQLRLAAAFARSAEVRCLVGLSTDESRRLFLLVSRSNAALGG